MPGTAGGELTLEKLYAKLAHLRARIGGMGPDQQGRRDIYKQELKSVVSKINELKKNK